MRPEEARALGRLGSEAAAGIAGQARDVHAGIAGRVFGLLGRPAEPVGTVHEQISSGAYAAARALTGSLVRAGARFYGLTRPHDAPSLAERPAGHAVVGVINGAWGDRLRSAGSPLALSLRRDGADIALDPGSLARAFADATGRLVVFAHGLGETEDAWRRRSQRHVPYGDRLRSELGYTPLFVRYNSGLHVSQNGRALDALMEAVTANWPVAVAEIALVGHSMGGLVARAACHYAAPGGWRERVRHVFMLGSPHKGAPLELAANAACHALSRLPETRPFATPIKVRGAGTKDLGYGYLVDEDWEGHDPDAFWTNTGTVVPFLESANQYFVSATLTRDAEHPLGRLVGDLLVRPASAWSHEGGGEPRQFAIDHYSHVGGVTHFDLLNHPAVYAQLRRWLTTGRDPSVAAGQRP